MFSPHALQLFTGLLEKSPSRFDPHSFRGTIGHVCAGLTAVLDKDIDGSAWCAPPTQMTDIRCSKGAVEAGALAALAAGSLSGIGRWLAHTFGSCRHSAVAGWHLNSKGSAAW